MLIFFRLFCYYVNVHGLHYMVYTQILQRCKGPIEYDVMDDSHIL